MKLSRNCNNFIMVNMFVKVVVGLLLIVAIQSSLIVLEKNKKFFIRTFEKNVPLNITVHVQDIGDIKGQDNQWVGTKGQSKRLQGFSIQLNDDDQKKDISFEYMAHLQDIGDTPYVKEGTFIGTRGQSRRLQGFAIRLTGKKADRYDIYYRAHIQDIGDSAYCKNGQFCGTRGQSKRVQAIFVRLVKKIGFFWK